MLKGFLIACVLALAIGAAAGFAMPADAAGVGAMTLQIAPVKPPDPSRALFARTKKTPTVLSGFLLQISPFFSRRLPPCCAAEVRKTQPWH